MIVNNTRQDAKPCFRFFHEFQKSLYQAGKNAKIILAQKPLIRHTFIPNFALKTDTDWTGVFIPGTTPIFLEEKETLLL